MYRSKVRGSKHFALHTAYDTAVEDASRDIAYNVDTSDIVDMYGKKELSDTNGLLENIPPRTQPSKLLNQSHQMISQLSFHTHEAIGAVYCSLKANTSILITLK